MVTNEIAMTPAGVLMLVSTTADDRVACPHCGLYIELGTVEASPGAMTMACPHCEERSLLVRLVSVLHRAVKLSGELWSQLGQEQARPRAGVARLRTPSAVFSLRVSRGAVVLLAMLWHRAERTGSVTLEASMTQLARRLLTTRAMVRRWMKELVEAGALVEVTPDGRTRGDRRWELQRLPVPGAGRGSGGEVDDAGR
ncbi:MAG: hypothetical protein AB1Z98_06145 [Nannocystaceae bacterium]